MALWGTVLWVPEEPARVDPDDRDPDHERADA
jgi:hypothetical protein